MGPNSLWGLKKGRNVLARADQAIGFSIELGFATVMPARGLFAALASRRWFLVEVGGHVWGLDIFPCRRRRRAEAFLKANRGATQLVVR